MFAVTTKVDQAGACAVRAAVQVDAVVPEIRPYVVQIVHRDVGRVLAYVGVVAREAPLQAIETRLARLGHLAQRVRVGAAVQRIRFPGAALIDQDDVACALDGAKGAADLMGELRGALAGSAGEKDEWVVSDRADRGQHDDPQADLAPGFGSAVFKNGQRSTVGIGGAVRARAGMKAVESTGAGTTSAGRGPEHQHEHEAGKKTRGPWRGPRRQPPGTVQVRG